MDSFLLDSYFSFDRCQKGVEDNVRIEPHFYPSVQAMSVYGDYGEALEHLNKRLIHTREPAEIHGGGLLKYCYLLTQGFKPLSQNMTQFEPYMCSRFFIDFQSKEQQYCKILNYAQRFSVWEESESFLDMLMDIVVRKALMESERQKTIGVIFQLKAMIYYSHFCQQTSNIYSHHYSLPYHGYSCSPCVVQQPCSS